MNQDPAETANFEELDGLIDEFFERSRQDSSLSPESFIAEHPSWQKELRDLLPAAIALDGNSKKLKTASAAKLPSIPDYRFVKELGRGGMGIVYKAEHAALGRMVAVKMLSPQLLPDAKARERFQREARATARLHHTSIVPVFEVGQTIDHSFYSMQLIEGTNLDERIREIRQSNQSNSTKDRCIEAARHGVSIARALQHAHDHQILHRDIKPSNVLIDNENQAWLSDFGLASISDGQVAQSQDLVGTLRYLAPERLRGHCDVRSDIYSLGLTLYEQIALEPALAGISKESLMAARRPSPSISSKVSDVPKDLATIIDKSMSDDPAARYDSAKALADDLEAFLENRPIQARPVSTIERLWMWSKRNPTIAVMVISLNSLLLVVAIGSLIAANQFKKLNSQTEALKDIAETKEQHASAMADIAQRNERSAQQVANYFSKMIQGADPAGLFTGHSRSVHSIDHKTTAFEWVRQSASSIDREDFSQAPLVEAKLKDTLAVALTGQMQMKQAQPLFERCMYLRQKFLPNDHPDLAASYEHLGTFYFYSGDPQTAADFYRRAMTIWDRRLAALKSGEIKQQSDDEVPSLRLSRSRTESALGLAIAYSINDRSELAHRLLQSSLLTRIEILGADTEEVAYCRIAFASILARVGRTEEALAEVHKAEETLIKIKGDQRLTQVFSLYTQGTAFQTMKMTDLAIERFKRAEQLMTEIFGPTHPLTVYARGEVAGALERGGRADEAVKLYRDVIDLSQVTMADQPYLGQSWDTMGIYYRNQNKFSEAIEAYEKALSIYQSSGLKEPHILIAKTELRLADALINVGRSKDAFDLFSSSAKQLELLPREIVGYRLPEVLHSMGYLTLWHQIERFPEVIEIIVRVGPKMVLRGEHEMLLLAGTMGRCSPDQAAVLLKMCDRMKELSTTESEQQGTQHLRGRIMWQLGRYDEGLEILSEGQFNELRVFQAALYRGLCLKGKGDIKGAKKLVIDATNTIINRIPLAMAKDLQRRMGDEILLDPNAKEPTNMIQYPWEQSAYSVFAWRELQ